MTWPYGHLLLKEYSVHENGSTPAVWVEQDYWPLNTALWVKDFHGNLPKFIYYFMVRIDFSRYAAGVSVPTLNRNLVHPIAAAIPEKPEQELIADTLDVLLCKIQSEEKRKVALASLFESLLHNLMTGQIRVHELDLPELKESS